MWTYLPTTNKVRFTPSGRIDFAHLLDVLHEHSKVENALAEIMGAFEAQDKDKKGLLSAAEISQVTSLGLT